MYLGSYLLLESSAIVLGVLRPSSLSASEFCGTDLTVLKVADSSLVVCKATKCLSYRLGGLPDLDFLLPYTENTDR